MDQNTFQLMVGSQIRIYRKAQGFSQEKLAEFAGIHPTYISNIERGKVSATAHILYKITQVLGIKLVDLFGILEDVCDSGFENEWVDITGKVKRMGEVQRDLYVAAIKGMLPK